MSEQAIDRPQVPEAFQKAATEAFGTLLDKLATSYSSSTSASSSTASSQEDGHGDLERPKSLFIDPFALIDTMGVGYRAAPQSLTFDTLRAVSEKDTIIASIIGRRVNQVSTFSQRQPNKYSVGYEVHLRGRHRGRRMTKSERDKVDYIEMFIQNTGQDVNVEQDNFTTFLKKFTRDSLTYDAGTFEKVRTLGGDPHSFFAMDASSIRFANPSTSAGTPPGLAELKSRIQYIQYTSAQRWREYTSDEMAYCVRNPRTSLRVYRYGFPEIEVLVNTVTGHLNAETWNRNIFTNGSTIKGFINVSGRVNQQKLHALERAWHSQVTGTANSHRLPIVNADDLKFVPLQLNNQEMGYQAWLEYLIKICCSVYGLDPSEIQFDLRGGIGQQPMFMSSNEAQQKVSRDQGLNPLLRFIADVINRHVVWQIDPRFEFSFVGLDAKTEEQNFELRSQQGQTTHTLNECRALEGLAPMPNGDVVLNPVYIGYLQQMQMAAQAGQQAGGATAEGEEPPPTEEDRAFFTEPGEEERQASSRLMQFADDKGDEKQEDQASEFDRLFQDDWTSDVHAAQKPGDLMKGLYDVLPLD